MKVYGVVTMDIVHSRKITNRQAFQERLQEHIKTVNEAYKSILPVPIDFTVGDEWQAILEEPEECYNLVHEFQRLLWKSDVSFYAGIGLGELSTGIYEKTGMMDGSCFLMARQAIETAKGKGSHRTKQIHSKYNNIFFKADVNRVAQGVLIKILDGIEEAALSTTSELTPSSFMLDEIINALIENTEVLKNRMTNKQKEVYINYIKYKSYRRMIKEAPDLTTESTSSISQKLNTANYFTIQNNHGVVKRLIGYTAALMKRAES